MRRNSHYHTCAILKKDKICDIYWDLFARKGIYRVFSYEHPLFFFVLCSSCEFLLYHNPVYELPDPILMLCSFHKLKNLWMLRSKDHKCHTIKRVRPCCEYGQVLASVFQLEINQSAFALSYPVLLHYLDPFRPVLKLLTLI